MIEIPTRFQSNRQSLESNWCSSKQNSNAKIFFARVFRTTLRYNQHLSRPKKKKTVVFEKKIIKGVARVYQW